MKTLPGLPTLPTGFWWEVAPSRISAAYRIEIKTLPANRLHVPETVAWDLTRSWPLPTARSVVGTARKIYARFERHTRSAIPGKYN